MIKFDADQVTFEFVLLKSVTTALGGSISIVNQEKTAEAGKEIYERIEAPLAVARSFIKKHKNVTRYLTAVWTTVVKYNGLIVALERHPMGALGTLMMDDGRGNTEQWKPYCENNFYSLVLPTMEKSEVDWFFDGRYAYTFNSNDLVDVVSNGFVMSEDGLFRKIIVNCFDFQEMAEAEKLQPQVRNCLALMTSTGEFAISPPIWKDLEAVGSKMDEDGNNVAVVPGRTGIFDRIDDNMGVNLNFTLKAGQEIGKLFGYDQIEPLQLPRLMIELHTVNLPNITKQVKATYNVGMKFTHAMAWMLGLSRKANTLDTLLVMRSLMKYLTQKGIFRNDTFAARTIFQTGLGVEDVTLKNVDELLSDSSFTQASIASLAKQVLTAKQSKSRAVSEMIGMAGDD